jgi:hypothetical protein
MFRVSGLGWNDVVEEVASVKVIAIDRSGERSRPAMVRAGSAAWRKFDAPPGLLWHQCRRREHRLAKSACALSEADQGAMIKMGVPEDWNCVGRRGQSGYVLVRGAERVV